LAAESDIQHRLHSQQRVHSAKLIPGRIEEDFNKDGSTKDAPISPAIAVAKALGQLHNGVVIPDYELLLSKCYTRFLGAGQVVFDVGSHAGFHLKQFISLVGPSGRVFAFEPIPALSAALRNTYRERPNVEIRSLALSDKPGRSEFLVLHQAIGMSGFKQRAGSGDQGAEKIMVPLETLDRQAADLSRLDYIKIDIEGAEISCLRGARQTVTRFRPLISVEYGQPSYSLFGNTAMTLFEWAHEHDYNISDLFGNLIPVADEWALVCDRSMWDYFLVPQERRQQWASLFK
jgi:FkbM family methyltransferase